MENRKTKKASKFLVFKIVMRDWESVNVSNTMCKYMPLIKINKTKRFHK